MEKTNTIGYVLLAKNCKKGAASLIIMIGLAMLILAVSAGILAVSISENLVSSVSERTTHALFFAESGAYDALQKIIRNKNFTAITPYQIEFVTSGCATNDGCAIISVGSASPKVITSTGYYKNIVRKVQVTVSYDADGNGEITNVNWQEINT